MKSTNRHDVSKDSGAAATALLLLAFVVSIAFVFVAVLPLLKGTDQAARTQTAVDAAALAGAEDVRKKILNDLWTIDSEASLASLLNSHDGRMAASQYAQRNGAELQSYQVEPLTGKIHVKVAHSKKTRASGGHVKSVAEANLGLSLTHCKFGEEELPPEPVPPSDHEPDEDQAAEEEEEPQKEFSYSFVCPGMPSFSDYDEFDDLVQDVRQALEPRLKPTLTK